MPDERKTPLETIIAGKPALISLREWRIVKPQAQVVCLHGLGVTGAEFAPMAASLNRAGFDVLAPDWIGHGDSDFIGDPKAYEWNCYFKCLAAVFSHCHSPTTHYVGTSWGAAILLIFLLSRRISPRSATFVDVALRSSPLLARHVKVFEEQSEKTFASLAEAKAFLAIQRPDFARVPEEYSDYFDAERYYRRGEGVAFKFDPALLPALAAGSSAAFDYFGALKRVNFNALFLFGVKSPYRLPFEFMTICAQAPHIRYRDDLPGGHPPTLLEEEQLAPVVNYIKQANLLR